MPGRPETDRPTLVHRADGDADAGALVLIKGYWSGADHERDAAAAYVAAARACGWRGPVYQCLWNAGTLAGVLNPVIWRLVARIGLVALARLLRVPVGARAMIPTELAAFQKDWTRAHAEAGRLGGAHLLPLIRGALGDQPVTLLGHSLGARAAHYALRAAAADPAQRFENAILLGGAHPRHDPHWAEAARGARGKVYNVHHPGDTVLKYLYRLGTLTTRGPCGLKPIRPPHRGVRNIDASRWLDPYRNSHNHYIDHLPQILGPRMCAEWAGETRAARLLAEDLPDAGA